MARISPRVDLKVAASIIDAKGKKYDAIAKNISFGGICLGFSQELPIYPNTCISDFDIVVSINSKDNLITTSRVVWRHERDLGFRFASIKQYDLEKIWKYMREILNQRKSCPYCSNSFDSLTEKCRCCGWKLNFLDRDYLAYWEKNSHLLRIKERLSDLNMDGLQKVLRFINEDMLFRNGQGEIETIKEFVGTCPAMREVFSLIRKVASTDLPVLILGESGTGKELTARAVFERSLRKDKPFVAINCTAIPDSLLEAELFGYEKGAFTGAYSSKKGKFEHAHKGTIFLDEIGGLPLNLQPKLLRVLETQMIERIGSVKSIPIDTRIITATNTHLENAVSKDRFRSDLYHRIKVFTISLPPLRKRGEDKTILAQYLFKRIKMEKPWKCRGFSPEALNVIRLYEWPGNVREMINRIRRAVVIQDNWIMPEDLELKSSKKESKPSKLKAANRMWKKELIETALREHQYNISQTARTLGISRPYLYHLIKKMGTHNFRKSKP